MQINQGSSPTGRIFSVWQASPVFGALFILIVINFLLLQANPLQKVDPEKLATVRSWVWWATQDYKNQQTPPEIVLLGSSLMMHPLWLQEAAYRKQDVDLVVDHQSHYLESVIKKYAHISSNVSCFNFAMPGCMVSDDCMIARTLFKGSQKPKMVVIGLGPRDFMDNRFNCAASSKHYQYLAHFADTSDLAELAMPQLWQRISYGLRDLVYFKNKSQDAQIVIGEWLRRLLQPILVQLPPSPLNRTTEEDRRFVIFRSEIEKGVWVAHPTSPYWYIDATGDCKKRHKSLNSPLFENQLKWLELCLNICQKENVAVVLVNMPVTPVALQCMGKNIYGRHIETLQKISQKWGCSLLDLNIPERYAPDDFTDWGHMDASGGEKVLAALGEFIGSNKNLVAYLVPSKNIAMRHPGNI